MVIYIYIWGFLIALFFHIIVVLHTRKINKNAEWWDTPGVTMWAIILSSMAWPALIILYIIFILKRKDKDKWNC